jgi:hypothetical protein
MVVGLSCNGGTQRDPLSNVLVEEVENQPPLKTAKARE